MMADWPENKTEIDPYGDYFNGDFNVVSPVPSKNSSQEFGRVFLPTLYSLIIIIGFIGNSLVVCVLAKHRKQTNLTDICLLNLALADLLFIFSLPFLAHYAAVLSWVFGDFLCRLTEVIYKLGFYGSIFFMVAMTLDRYAVIVHAHTSARHRTVGLGIALSVSVWTLSLLVSLPTLIFTQEVSTGGRSVCKPLYPEGSHWEEFDRLEMNILGFLVPLLVMVFCYSMIFVRLLALRSTKRHRAIKLIVAVVAAFFCFWTPYNVVVFLLFLQSRGVYSPGEGEGMKLAILVTETIAFVHCCLNPVIYAFAGQKFMQRVVKMLRSWAPRCLFAASARDRTESSTWRSSGKSTSTFNM